MICLEQVEKRYGRHGEIVALDGISLVVEEGDFVLLTGPSGAGKSTLLRLLFAAERPDAGRVTLFDHDVGRLRRSAIPYLRRNIGVVFQDFKLLLDRSALANVSLALEVRSINGREAHHRAALALESVGLGTRLETKARHLSAGEQQRVAIARAIVGDPVVLLADEPTGNLDPALTQELLVLLSDIHCRGTTVMLATHDREVMSFGALQEWRALRLERGRIVTEEPQTSLNVLPFPARAAENA